MLLVLMNFIKKIGGFQTPAAYTNIQYLALIIKSQSYGCPIVIQLPVSVPITIGITIGVWKNKNG
jgi:hypothetical protein